MNWREVDREAQRQGISFDLAATRMGLDPKKVRKQKAKELKKAVWR